MANHQAPQRGPVRTSFEYPPIPLRQFDWCAWHDGEEESNRCGWGRTEAEAIHDLAELDEADTEAA